MSEEFGMLEPPAHLREFAKFLRDMYVSLCKEGFTDQQALGIVGAVIAANLGGNK